jgi:hypothetical protein
VDRDTPELGQDERSIVEPRAVAILLETERMVAGAALKAREARFLAPRDAPEEGLIRLVEPREHVVQDMGVEGGVLGKLRTDGLELGFLREARNGDMAAPPGSDTLLQGGVVELAAAPQDFLQRPLLGGRGPQLFFVGFMAGHLVHIPVF